MNKNASPQSQTGYQVHITGRHVLVTEAMKNYAMEKLAKLERLAHRIIDVHVMMDIQKLEHRVDIVILFNHTKVKVEATSADMYVSIDRAIHKLEHQIIRYKERLQEHQAKSISVIEMNVDVLSAGSAEEINEDIEALNRLETIQRYTPHQVVRQEMRPLKTLTQSEAVMKMELSQDQFMIYRNEADQKLKVIYRRQDNDYGIIEPER